MHTSDKELDDWINKYLNINTDIGKSIYKAITKDDNINTEVDSERMSCFLSSLNNIERYFTRNGYCDYEIVTDIFNTSKKNADYTIMFDKMYFSSFDEFKNIIDGASWMCLGVSDDDRVSLTVEFWDCATEVK